MSDRPILAGALGALVIAFSGILVRLAEVSPSTAAFFRCAYALPLLGALAWVERRRYGARSRRDRLLAFGAGVFFAADLVTWHYSIDAVGAGLATVLGNVQVVLVGLIAWAALGERPENRTLAAIPIVFLGVVLISGVIGVGAYGDDPALGAVYGTFTAITYALFILILRQGNSDIRRPAGPLFDATLTGALFSGLAGVAIGDMDWAPGAESQALAGPARALLAGARLAPDLRLAAAAACRAHLDPADAAAREHGLPRRRAALRGAVGAPARGGGGGAGRRGGGHDQAARAGGRARLSLSAARTGALARTGFTAKVMDGLAPSASLGDLSNDPGDDRLRDPRGFRGTLLRDGDEGYDDARRVFNASIDRRPGADRPMRRRGRREGALAFAREQGLDVSVRGGGHSVAGHASWTAAW